MTNIQYTLLQWVAHQPGITGAVLFAAGLLYALCGFRLIRYVAVLPCCGLGCLVGATVASWLEIPPGFLTGALGAAGAALALHWVLAGVVVSCGATWVALAGYLALQFGFSATIVTTAAIIAGVVGTVLTLLSRNSMIVLVTTIQGAALIVLGFTGMATEVLPTVGGTFRRLAADYALTVPVLLMMLAFTAYSCQVSAQQGDIIVGAEAPPRL